MARPRSGWRRALRIGSAALALLALAPVGILLGLHQTLQLPRGRDFVRARTVAALHELIPGLELGFLGGAPPWEIVLGGIVLRDPEGGEAVRVDGVWVSIDPRALTAGAIRVKRILVLGPRVQARPLADGSLNLSRLITPSKKPPEPSSPSTLELAVERISLVGGAFRLQQAGTKPVELGEIELAARFGMKGEDLSAGLERLALRGRVAGLPPLALELGSKASLTDGSLAAELGLRLDGLLPNGAPLELEARGRGPLDRLVLDLDLRPKGAGRVRVHGSLATPLRYSAHVSLVDLAPRRLLASLPPARITAELDLRGAGTPLGEGSHAELTLALRPLQLHGIAIRSLAIEGALAGTRARLRSARAEIPGLTLTASGSADLARKSLEASATVTLAGKLPAALAAVEGAATIAAKASGSFAPGGALSAEARIRAARIARAGLVLSGLDAKLEAGGLPRAPSGRFQIAAARLTPAPGSPPLEAISLAGTARPDRVALRGSARGRGVGARLRVDARLARDGSARVTLEELALAHPAFPVVLRAPTLVRFQPRPLAVELSPTRLGVLGGSLALEGRLRATGADRLRASFTARRLRVPRLGAVSAEGDLRWGTRTLRAELDATLGPRRHPLRLRASLPLRGGGPLPPPARRGPVALELRTDGLELPWLARLSGKPLPLGGRVTLAADVKGRLEAPSVDLRLALEGGRYAKLVEGISLALEAHTGAGESSLSLDAREQGRPLLRTSARVQAGPAELAAAGSRPAALESVPVEARLEVPWLALARLAPLVPALRGLPGRAALELSARGTATRPSLELKLRGRGLSRAVRSLGVPAARHQLRGVELRLKLSGDPAATRAGLELDLARTRLLEVSGELGAAPLGIVRGRRSFATLPVRGRLTIPSFELARIAATAAAFGVKGLGGRLSASAEVGGSLEHPTGRAELALSSPTALGARLDRVALSARLERREARSELEVTQSKTGRIHASLEAPLPALTCRPRPGRACPPLSVKLELARLELGPFAPLVSSLRRLAGRLDGRLEAELRRGGPPRGRGSLTLEGGAVTLPSRPPIEGIALKLRLAPERLDLDELRVPAGKGKLELRGWTTLTPQLRPGRFELHAGTDALPLSLLGVDGVRLDARASVTGALDPSRGLDASFRLERGVVRIDKLPGGGKTLHETEPLPEVRIVRSLDEAPAPQAPGAPARGAPAASGAVPFPLRARATIRSLLLRGKELNTEVAGELALGTNRKGELTLSGELSATGGRIEILKRQYEIDRVRVSFNGAALAQLDPRVDVLISRRFPGATAVIAVTGSAKAPELKLRSEPPIYDSSQVLALVLTGQPDVAQGGAGSSFSVASLVLQATVGWMLEKISPVLALDVIRLDQVGSGTKAGAGQDEQSTRLEVGRYVTDRIYLGYRHIFNTPEGRNANEGRVEWRIAPRWSLEAAFGDAGAGGLDLFWTYWY